MTLGRLFVGMAITAAAVAATVVVLNRRHETWDRQMREGSRTFRRSTCSEAIVDALREHEGEGSPMVRCFEEALEEEARLERRLARETGLEI